MPKKSQTTTARARRQSRTKAASTQSRAQHQGIDLSTLFTNALKFVMERREELNALDRYNGNHGDNMVANLRLILEALENQRSEPPAEALRHASQVLQARGAGGTSQYYAAGLQQAANQFQGRSSIGAEDVVSLVQMLLGAVPAEGHPQQQEAGGSVLEQLLGLQAPVEQQEAGGGLLEQLLGLQAPPSEKQAQEPEAGDVLSSLLPAGLAFLQARQAGTGTASALVQAVIGALAGGKVNPLQSGMPRVAGGGLIAQALLQALLGK